VNALHVHDSRDDGAVVVWLGSLGSSASMWQPQLERLDDAGFAARHVRVDLPGHGARPGGPAPTTIAGLADAVIAALDANAVGRARFVGLSIGGMIAMRLATHHAERVDGLGLLCTSPQLGPAAAWHERAAVVRSDGMRAVADAVVGRWLSPDYAATHPDDVDAFVAMVASTDPESYACCCEAIAAMDQRADLPSISAPTLVVAGASDPATPPAHAELIARLVPGARLEIVPGAHLASWESADAVTALLADHFQGARR
jgi:3-oxoadipate enol-lactonase